MTALLCATTFPALESGELGVRLGDRMGMRLSFRVRGQGWVDAGDAGRPPLAIPRHQTLQALPELLTPEQVKVRHGKQSDALPADPRPAPSLTGYD